MNLLSAASALNPGSNLWIVPDLSHSRWAQKIDWYLNFQIVKTHRHPSPSLRNFTVFLQKETGLEIFPTTDMRRSPLMISSHNFLPNKWVVVVPGADSLKQWIRQTSNVWENLKHPSLRVFLPTGQSTSDFHSEWLDHHNFEDFTLVLD